MAYLGKRSEYFSTTGEDSQNKYENSTEAVAHMSLQKSFLS